MRNVIVTVVSALACVVGGASLLLVPEASATQYYGACYCDTNINGCPISDSCTQICGPLWSIEGSLCNGNTFCCYGWYVG